MPIKKLKNFKKGIDKLDAMAYNGHCEEDISHSTHLTEEEN
jgi:hypothetical protein